MAERRAINGAHWPNARFWHLEQCLRSVGPTGAVTLLHIQAFDDALINSHRDDENCGTFGKLRYGYAPQGIPAAPERLIHVRCYHPFSLSLQPRAYAEHIANMLADWRGSRDQADLRANLWDDPFVCVSSSNETNLHYENGDPNPANQWMYQTVDHYKRLAEWDLRFWERIDELVPSRRALRVSPAVAEGHEPDGYPVDGHYQIPEMRAMIEAADILGVHLYAVLNTDKTSGVDGANKYWYIFRAFRPPLFRDESDPGGVVMQFKGKPFLATEAGTFTHSDKGRTDETWANMHGLYVECLSHRTCLGVTWFIWNSDGAHPQNTIWTNEALRGKMEAAPRYWTDAAVPVRQVLPPVVTPPTPEASEGFAVGPGVLAAMEEMEDAPATSEVYIGAPGRQMSLTRGKAGHLYVAAEEDGWKVTVH